MKKTLVLLLFVLSNISFSQTKEGVEICFALQSNNVMSDIDAEDALERILDVIGASKNFALVPCDKISNAVATAYKGTRYILYDKKFMSLINQNTNDWSSLFILAHEVGHHINGHSLDILLYASDVVDAPTLEKKRKQELEADEFAAFVLAKLGASLAQLNNVIKLIADNDDDTFSTHPNRTKRLQSVKEGFKRGFEKKEIKTVYVDSKNLEYDKNENYIKNGAWYTKIKEDIFEGKEIESFTVGKIAGNLYNYTDTPNLLYKITFDEFKKVSSKYNAISRGQLILDANWEVVFPGIGDGQRVNTTIIVLGKNNTKTTYYINLKLHSKIGEKIVIDDAIYRDEYNLLKSGSSIVVRFDGYKEGDSEYDIYNKMLYERYKLVEHKSGVSNNFNKDELLKWYKNFHNRCWRFFDDYYSQELDCENEYYKYACQTCTEDKNWKLHLEMKGKYIEGTGRYYYEEEEKIKNISKSKAASSKYKNLKDSYFQYSLSGSSKALSL